MFFSPHLPSFGPGRPSPPLSYVYLLWRFVHDYPAPDVSFSATDAAIDLSISASTKPLSDANLPLLLQSGRDFFKLNRIELRCKVSDSEFIVVEPKEDTVPDLLTLLDSPSPTPNPCPDSVSVPIHPETETMEIDSRPPLPPPAGLHRMRHEQHHHELPLPNQSMQQLEANKKSLPSLSMRSPQALPPLHTIPPPKLSTSPFSSTSPAVKPVSDIQHANQLPSMDTVTSQAGNAQELPPVLAQSRSPHQLHNANGQPYARSPPGMRLGAIDHLQAQISHNNGALAAHARDIQQGAASFHQLEDSLRRELQDQLVRQSGDLRRVDDAIARLHLEMQDMRHLLENLTHELNASRAERQSRGANAAPGQPASVQDSALELMAQQIAAMSQKTNEVDTLKITIEIMKNKIQRLEEATFPAPTAPSASSQPLPQVYQSPTEPMAPAPQPTHPSTYHPPPAAAPHATPVQMSKTQGFTPYETPSSTVTPDASQHNTWASVNAGVKRSHQHGVESPHDASLHASGSPKRQRLGPGEPHIPLPAPQMHIENLDSRTHAYPPSIASQHSIPEPTLASQPRQAVYIPYGTQEAPPDDSWRPESQRIVEHRPRGRGRGGGPGSRGGRVRKSLPPQHGHGTPEWEKSEWQGYSEPQASPDFHNHVAGQGRGIARRGSGGGGGTPSARGGYGDRAVSLGLPGVTAGISVSTPHDPYAHTKKTRTKPIRNADGVLIRKDGRPDMRSQSSAANLRKVHARKEGDPNLSPSGFTPASLQHSNSVDTPETPSPTSRSPDEGVTDSVHRKHNAIMDKMFPSGVDESRKQHDYGRQIFEEGQDHTVHPRTQHHGSATKSDLEVKKEQVEQNQTKNTESPEKTGAEPEHHSRGQQAQASPKHKEPAGQEIEASQEKESSHRVDPTPPVVESK